MPKTSPWLDPRRAETFADRIAYCRSMLYLHEFLSESENERVKARQLNRFAVPENAVIVDRRTGKPIN